MWYILFFMLVIEDLADACALSIYTMAFAWIKVYSKSYILASLSVPAILFRPLGCIVLKTLTYLSILSVPDDGYSRNVSCALNLISTFLFTYLYKIHTYLWHLFWHIRYKQHSFGNELKLQLYPCNYKHVGLTNMYVGPFKATTIAI